MSSGRRISGCTRAFTWTPVLVVCLSGILSAYSLTSLFPYVGFMVADFTGVPLDETGFLAGYVSSAFPLGRIVTSYPLGWAADRFGRKPVLLMSLLALAILSVIFGLSTSFTMAIASRFMLGLTNATVSTVRALMPELAGEEKVVVATSLMAGARSFGLVFGPAAGGFLSQPAQRFPSVFSSTGMFGRYPYLLPNLVAACLGLITIPLTVWLVPETRKLGGGRRERSGQYPPVPLEQDDSGDARNRAEDNEEVPNLTVHVEDTKGCEEEQEIGIFGPGGLMSVPHVPALLTMGVIYSAANIAFEEVYPLWALSSKEAGGLEYDPQQIGLVLMTSGFGLMVLQVLVYARLVKAFGMMTVHHGVTATAMVLMLIVPNMAYLSWNDTSLMAVSMIVISLAQGCMGAVFTGLILASTNPVPPRMRGKLSGLFLLAQSIGRTVGPAGGSVIYAWSITRSGRSVPLVNHRFVFTVFAAMLGLVGVMGAANLSAELMTNVVREPIASPKTELTPRGAESQNGATSFDKHSIRYEAVRH